MNIQTALLSIQALLTAAEPDDPQDWEVAEMYKQDRQKYENKAREWVRLYAQEGMITDKEEMVGVRLSSSRRRFPFRRRTVSVCPIP